MKSIFAILPALLLFLFAPSVLGQSIAVVHIKTVFDEYYKTKQEVARINEVGRQEIRNIDERKASYKEMTSEMMKLDEEFRSPSLSEDKRRAARDQLEELAKTRMAKANEINDAERRANRLLSEARQKMEVKLMAEILQMVDAICKANNFDIVFDKSHLPSSRTKSIVFTSNEIADLTNEVIKQLNKNSP